MQISDEIVRECELLLMFNLESAQSGLKIHHEADAERIASAQRLYDKKLITQVDGGYLTPLGIEAAEHAQALLRLLQEDS